MRVWFLGLNSLLFRAHSSSRYSIAALLGAIEIDPRLTELRVSAPIELSHGIIQQKLNQGSVAIAHSVMSTQLERVRKEVKEVRNRFNRNVVLIAGGPHASARPMDLIKIGFDYVVIGEAEHSFSELLWYLVNNRQPDTIPGVVKENSEYYPTPKELNAVSLDEYPPFALAMNIVGPIEVTRGCPFSCKFCCTPFLTGSRVRHRSIESVIFWLRRAVEERGFERTWFLSPNALCYGGKGRNVVKDKLENLLKESKSIDGLDEVFFGSFPSEVRPEFVRKDVLEMMRQYVANTTIQIGLQSASDRVLKLANRHHTVADGINAVRTALECDFVPHVDIIFGLPGETPEDIQANLELCHSLIEMGAKMHGHVFMPLPGSPYENMPPGRLDQDTRKTLGDLSRKGLLTGSWSNQEQLAQQLATS